jgi:parvulin-like peptidyl-prolyl cis-trans isomerase-like protein
MKRRSVKNGRGLPLYILSNNKEYAVKDISSLQKLSPWLGLFGAVLITVGLFNNTEAELKNTTEENKIVVSHGLVKSMVENAVSENPSFNENIKELTQKMEEAAVGQELLVAEAFGQGLAISDYIVRNRMVEMQVMSLYERADTLVSQDKALEFYKDNPDRYMALPRRRYLHLYVPINNLIDENMAKEKLQELFKNKAGWGYPKWVAQHDLSKAYGPTLANTVFDMPVNEWSDAIKSSFGWHYIKVLDETPSSLQEFDKVSFRVLEDLRRKLRQDAYQTELDRLKNKYEVEWVD